ncbi:MAG: ATP-binding protein [Candidatus Methanomethylophilaceae archaeon]
MRKLILRKRYMDELNGLRDHRELIKVISGIKGCGKSTLVKQFIISLRSAGVRNEDIVYLDLDHPCAVREHSELCSFLERNDSGGRMYIFLDDIVMIRNWEQSIEWIRNNLDADLYLTCSNTNRFAPDMMTGTYTVKMLPLSFREFVELNPCDISYESMRSRYGDYIRVGSLPAVRTNMEPETVNELLTGIQCSILVREVMPWNEIRNFDVMYRVMGYVMENCCSLMSPANIASNLNLKNQKAVDSYLVALEETHLIIRIPRYDLRARQEMKTNSKYYLTDVGLRSASVGYGEGDAQRMLENVVLMELLRRDYTVMVGSYRGTEIDFVAKRNNDTEYFQVAASLTDDITDDEIDLLISVNGRHKTIITADDEKYNDLDGIRIMNFIDFLMDD